MLSMTNYLSITVEANDKFLEWINQKGAAESLLTYTSQSAQAPTGPDKDRKRSVNQKKRAGSLNYKNQYLVTMFYLYSGEIAPDLLLVLCVPSCYPHP